MRCPDCNKFVSCGDAEPEVNDYTIIDRSLEAEVRLPLPCADCGTELKDNEFSIQADVDHECPAKSGMPHYVVEDEAITCKYCGQEFELEGEHWCNGLAHITKEEEQITLDDCTAEFYDERETHKSVPTTKAEKAAGKGDFKMKPIPYGYQTQYYGVKVTFECTCHRCGEKFTVEAEEKESAGSFNELV